MGSTSEMLAECEAMLQRLEAVNAAATPGEWRQRVGDNWEIGGDGYLIGEMSSTANARAVCVWKKLAARMIVDHAEYLKMLRAVYDEQDMHNNWEEMISNLHAELKEATDGL